MDFSTRKGHTLSVFSLTMINVIAIDSLRNLPINATYGYSILFFYLLGTLLFLLPGVLVTAELATTYPETGGSYVWVRAAFGERWGFFNVWLQWIYNIVWYPTILSFIAASLAYLINPVLADDKFFMLPVVLGTFLIATLLNSVGMKTSSWVSIIGAIFGTIIPMLFIIGLGIIWVWQGHPLAIPFSPSKLLPDLHHFNNIAFIVVILFSLMGIEMSAVHAGEVKNPSRDFPKALRYSSIIIVSTLGLASLAIAIVVPPKSINLISGLNQAFTLFLQAHHLQSLTTVAIALIIFGGFAAMCAWVIGPTKGLMVAAQEGCAPKMLGKTNRHGAPGRVLILQAVIVCLLCSLFLCFENFSTSYWILSDLTAQLALVYYISFFAAAIRLRYKKAPAKGYRIPGGKLGIWLVAGIGIVCCVGAVILGFIPPTNVPLGNIVVYESILIGGMLIFIIPPFFIYHRQRRAKSKSA